MFYKKGKQKVGGKTKWFPRAVTISSNPATTKDLAQEIAYRSSATPGDVYLVLSNLPQVMALFMDQGRPVHIDGLGSFYFKLSCAGRGVDSPEEVDRKQIRAVRVQFLPERRGRGKSLHSPLTAKVRLTEWETREEIKEDE